MTARALRVPAGKQRMRLFMTILAAFIGELGRSVR
jgi:hypothetical protein